MKSYQVFIIIDTLVGQDKRNIVVRAKSEKSALNIVDLKMGNREYYIEKIVVVDNSNLV